MGEEERAYSKDKVAAEMAAFFENKYGSDMGPTIYLNLMDAMTPYELDGDLILGTHQLEIFIDEETGEVEVTKTLSDNEETA